VWGGVEIEEFLCSAADKAKKKRVGYNIKIYIV